ncbi:DsbC family protein [Methyloterricola oryzae]|uniref:DsbC family protein n=1 Tax=Methyloterricola oryzae TaxID=1495050 RepID=UPI0005EBA890|nr:DsbC family protein [Methyloterricola oryzae]
MKKRFLTFMIAGLTAVSAVAAEAPGATKAIEDSLKLALPGMKPDSIKPSPISGLYEVMVGPKLFYVSGDGNYLIQGSLIDVKAKEDLTEPRVAEARMGALNKVGGNRMISFKPKITKHHAYVFTDIDCGYCRKLHSEIDQYGKEGIEISYLFFPRAGEGSDSWKKAISVWCSSDRNGALTKAKKGETVESKSCDNPVAEHYALGNAIGAQGTPMIVTEKGNVLPGYVPAKQLAKILETEASTNKSASR